MPVLTHHAEVGVRVVDEAGQPVAGASVAGVWSELTAGRETELTAADGMALFISTPTTETAGAFMLTLTGVSKGNWSYDPSANAESSWTVPLEAAPPKLHVGGVTVELASPDPAKPGSVMAWAAVLVVDAQGSPVAGARVAGFWSGLAADSDAALTGADGRAVVYSNSSKAKRGRFTFTVTGLSEDGWVWDLAADVATSRTVVLG